MSNHSKDLRNINLNDSEIQVEKNIRTISIAHQKKKKDIDLT